MMVAAALEIHEGDAGADAVGYFHAEQVGVEIDLGSDVGGKLQDMAQPARLHLGVVGRRRARSLAIVMARSIDRPLGLTVHRVGSAARWRGFGGHNIDQYAIGIAHQQARIRRLVGRIQQSVAGALQAFGDIGQPAFGRAEGYMVQLAPRPLDEDHLVLIASNTAGSAPIATLDAFEAGIGIER